MRLILGISHERKKHKRGNCVIKEEHVVPLLIIKKIFKNECGAKLSITLSFVYLLEERKMKRRRLLVDKDFFL